MNIRNSSSLTDLNNSFKHGLMNTPPCGIHKHKKLSIIGYKAQINTFQRISILKTIFSDRNAVNLEINNIKVSEN